MSFTPAQLALEIQKHIPDFTISYAPDFRQALADSWPDSIDDSVARNDWGWKAFYDTPKLVDEMIREVGRKTKVKL
jgi:nucleoside-diphosphate-sugar epimerase